MVQEISSGSPEAGYRDLKKKGPYLVQYPVMWLSLVPVQSAIQATLPYLREHACVKIDMFALVKAK